MTDFKYQHRNITYIQQFQIILLQLHMMYMIHKMELQKQRLLKLQDICYLEVMNLSMENQQPIHKRHGQKCL